MLSTINLLARRAAYVAFVVTLSPIILSITGLMLGGDLLITWFKAENFAKHMGYSWRTCPIPTVINGWPQRPVSKGSTSMTAGRTDALLTRRDTFALQAPITKDMVDAVWGDTDVNLHDETTRAAYFAVWSLLAYEWADALIWHADNWKDA